MNPITMVQQCYNMSLPWDMFDPARKLNSKFYLAIYGQNDKTKKCIFSFIHVGFCFILPFRFLNIQFLSIIYIFNTFGFNFVGSTKRYWSILSWRNNHIELKSMPHLIRQVLLNKKFTMIKTPCKWFSWEEQHWLWTKNQIFGR